MQRLAFWCAQTKGMKTTGMQTKGDGRDSSCLATPRVSSGVAGESHSATSFSDAEKWPGRAV